MPSVNSLGNPALIELSLRKDKKLQKKTEERLFVEDRIIKVIESVTGKKFSTRVKGKYENLKNRWDLEKTLERLDQDNKILLGTKNLNEAFLKFLYEYKYLKNRLVQLGQHTQNLEEENEVSMLSPEWIQHYQYIEGAMKVKIAFIEYAQRTHEDKEFLNAKKVVFTLNKMKNINLEEEKLESYTRTWKRSEIVKQELKVEAAKRRRGFVNSYFGDPIEKDESSELYTNIVLEQIEHHNGIEFSNRVRQKYGNLKDRNDLNIAFKNLNQDKINLFGNCNYINEVFSIFCEKYQNIIDENCLREAFEKYIERIQEDEIFLRGMKDYFDRGEISVAGISIKKELEQYAQKVKQLDKLPTEEIYQYTKGIVEIDTYNYQNKRYSKNVKRPTKRWKEECKAKNTFKTEKFKSELKAEVEKYRKQNQLEYDRKVIKGDMPEGMTFEKWLEFMGEDEISKKSTYDFLTVFNHRLFKFKVRQIIKK